ncbi:NAD(P)H-binding protein [Amycolatopsis thermophila]|uniref:NAD(P)H-binding protein n=1 Tax=Amycolatopsis thermophila TaxID=206084 RepID=UPI003521B051
MTTAPAPPATSPTARVNSASSRLLPTRTTSPKVGAGRRIATPARDPAGRTSTRTRPWPPLLIGIVDDRAHRPGRADRQQARRILQQPEPVRLVVRDSGKLPAEVRERAGIVAGSHCDREVVDRALDGADAFSWLMPAGVTASIPGADALVRHAVPRVVIISALGRGSQIYAGHISASHVMEDVFRTTGASARRRVPARPHPNGAGHGRCRPPPPRDRRNRHRRPRRAAPAPGVSEAMAQSMMDMDVAGERGINNATLPRTPPPPPSAHSPTEPSSRR